MNLKSFEFLKGDAIVDNQIKKAINTSLIKASFSCAIMCILVLIFGFLMRKYLFYFSDASSLIISSRLIFQIITIIVATLSIVYFIVHLIIYFRQRNNFLAPKFAWSIILYLLDGITMCFMISYVAAIVGLDLTLIAIGISLSIIVAMGILGFIMNHKIAFKLGIANIVLFTIATIGSIILLIVFFTTRYNHTGFNKGVIIADIVLSIIWLLALSIGFASTIYIIKVMAEHHNLDNKKIMRDFTTWNSYLLFASFNRILLYVIRLFLLFKRV
ncbi:hypothetical protein WFS18_03045 [Ureaplasma parvum]|uniref:Uncharacterized protein n=3 Tax=Ureaplasma parvum TaxID=134821 RepID=A0AAC9T3F0_UREPR|nr:hypothetical protein [Ureaplasma parvum]pir/H82897/ hypothetical protein UU390 [imported] - Ureaplasma urealyticum [Ureaplasma urealyticum]AAF30800.1 unique hypothetical [Ureaplasma parvum serovar 3 str. ATCC 700970]ACA32896.1 putative membrane protein [Ureaplasma parvum serovar 3 str. ATCC 27815]ASD24887.1 hypothetical protein CEE64_00090 [Ureaplasma parvum]ASD28690.1 hypothetical protein CEG40_00455 [Ureaplasma parvum]ASD30055.1 hypothetical protein CEG42_02405 [Ureaplasma parvum]